MSYGEIPKQPKPMKQTKTKPRKNKQKQKQTSKKTNGPPKSIKPSNIIKNTNLGGPGGGGRFWDLVEIIVIYMVFSQQHVFQCVVDSVQGFSYANTDFPQNAMYSSPL